MRKNLRLVYSFLCSMGHCFFEVEGIACFDAAQRHAGGRVVAALTDQSAAQGKTALTSAVKTT
jgi:hypothetical protein